MFSPSVQRFNVFRKRSWLRVRVSRAAHTPFSEHWSDMVEGVALPPLLVISAKKAHTVKGIKDSIVAKF